MLYIQVNESMFIQRFFEYGRQNDFSRAALCELYDFYDFYNDIDDNAELDVIAICCDWSELTIDEIKKEYSNCLDIEQDDDDIISELEYNTTVIHVETNDTYLVMAW
jgi:hypothetical protein